jgi:hypothetical protein
MVNKDENDETTPWWLPIHDNKSVRMTIDKFDESLEKSVDLVDKSHDDTCELEKTITCMA